MRVLRLLRVLRVIRLLKLKRYNDALIYRAGLKLISAEAILFTGVAFVFIIGFAFLIFDGRAVEAQPDVYRNIFDSIWWATISLTSVGYGDVYPVAIVRAPFDAGNGADRHGDHRPHRAAGVRAEPGAQP